jgi:hypothetical protein
MRLKQVEECLLAAVCPRLSRLEAATRCDSLRLVQPPNTLAIKPFPYSPDRPT